MIRNFKFALRRRAGLNLRWSNWSRIVGSEMGLGMTANDIGHAHSENKDNSQIFNRIVEYLSDSDGMKIDRNIINYDTEIYYDLGIYGFDL